MTARPLFSLGQVLATPGAISLMERLGIDPSTLIRRHVTGDWGTIHPEDRGLNEAALVDGSRIMSVYGEDDDCLWVITETRSDPLTGASGDEGHRAATTILRPDEY